MKFLEIDHDSFMEESRELLAYLSTRALSGHEVEYLLTSTLHTLKSISTEEALESMHHGVP